MSGQSLLHCCRLLTITFRALRWLSSRYNKSLQLSVATLQIGPVTSAYTCVYVPRSIELGLIMSLGAEYLAYPSTLGHEQAQIRWIQLREFTLNITCTQHLSRSPLLHPSCCSLLSLQAWMKIRATASIQRHINGSKVWDQKATLIYKSLVWEFNSKAQPLLGLKLTHYLAFFSHSHWPHHEDEPVRMPRNACRKWDVNVWKSAECGYSKICLNPMNLWSASDLGW